MYTQQRFVLMALDPIHIGAGGYRLGRVDLSIAREPGTNLPKIPGTSLAGAARSYAAMRYEKPQCAGQGQGDTEAKRHCGGAACPICYTFGHVKGAAGGYAGAVSLADAQLLLFPVHSMAGPVWVTTRARLEQAGFTVTAPELKHGQFATTLAGWSKPLNLGWLLLDKAGAETLTIGLPKLESKATLDLQSWQDVAGKVALVDDSLFSQIVNSNLEVRTSVSIDPHTGAAKEGALFTYEALPRASWLWCDVVEDDYRRAFPKDHPKASELKHGCPLHVAKAGLQLAEYLGVGGMGTRGFGRMKLMGDWTVSHE
jgi:CRISPR-associated protein Cmr4